MNAEIVRDRHANLPASRAARDLAAALGCVAELVATVAELRRQLAAATAAGTSNPAKAGLNRAARRAAERDRRRHGH